MDESYSPVILIYGMAIVVGVGKACTLLIWRTLPRPRPGLRQELRDAWRRRTPRPSHKGNRRDPVPIDPEPASPDAARQP